ncbi:ATP-dependent helicase [Desulfuromonas versatilis]|uniref:ATP-dependent helicase n=1 Tax=Desulfuromonas versatilis TaxID=2802975 RepID=A0ABM8HWD6_9BACT|nr:PD-(D/E)XK nuclease family protein [Desulfuromonas versatilis]BCR05068.1 ATP-dependent helicase [Desulfuromonas versatilis]
MSGGGGGLADRALELAFAGATILTVNKRLARHLRTQFDERMAAAGRGAWETPRIASLDAWLHEALAELGEEWRLLGSFAAQRLWEQAIEQDAAGSALLQIGASARQAMEARRLLAEYGGDPRQFPATEDHAAFLRWEEAYRGLLQSGGWLDPPALLGCVTRAVADGALTVPDKLALTGFDELSPALAELCSALAGAGCQLSEIPPDREPAGRLGRLPCADARSEVRGAARWARRLLETGAGSIGIVVPNLDRYRPLIERIFREEIDPDAQLRSDAGEDKFSLSLGAPLAEQGMVSAAFKLLGVGVLLPLDQASLLLRSPYLKGAQSEAAARAGVEVRLRKKGLGEFHLNALVELAKAEAPVMAGIFLGLGKNLGETRKRQPGAWAGHFAATLKAAGWPGERPLNSLDYQLFQAWQDKALSGMAALDAVCPPLERSAALGLLRRLAAETVFQPEAPAGPVQVLGVLEAAGLSFDHLWVMGLAEDALPAPPRPNPFLPVPLQVAQGMPHAGAERERSFAEKLVARLFAAAPEVILSHPEWEGDCELRPSPFVSALPTIDVQMAPSHAPAARLQAEPAALERLLDTQGPPVAVEGPVQGGTGLLKDQALCPFRAFAHHRLWAAALESPEVGLDPGTRGNLAHAVLECFWKQTRSHAALCALPETELRQRVETCVESVLDEQLGERKGEGALALRQIEGRRLAALALEWLGGVELDRAPFVVEESEKEHFENFGGLTIRTKVDRIDAAEDGSRLIIDYKTGRPDLADLLAERLLEPQLPVYGIGEGGERLGAVAFGVLRAGECGFKGVARDAGLLPKVDAFAGSKAAEKNAIADWDSLLAHWRSQLDKLGAEFLAGAAAVDPVDLVKACRYCDLAPLCRITEAQPLPEEDA